VSVRLEVAGVTAGYGRITVLREVSIAVPHSGVAAVLGANGAGKSTLLRTIAGILHPTAGRVLLDGRRLDRLPPHTVANRGVMLVPEGKAVFPGLTVEEHLEIALRSAGHRDAAAGRERIAALLDQLPNLADRLRHPAGMLSGGEQQMLALSRALLAPPRVLLLDEVSRGLAPAVTSRLLKAIHNLVEHEVSVLIVEQFTEYALDLADVCYVLESGRVASTVEPAQARSAGLFRSALSTPDSQ
jgi:branched-chain amino acid transport system ATP-binding protein